MHFNASFKAQEKTGIRIADYERLDALLIDIPYLFALNSASKEVPMQISPSVDNHASTTDRSPVAVGWFPTQDKGAVLFALPERLGRVNV